MRDCEKSQAGVSLVEVLISLVLLSLVALFIFSTQNKAQKLMFKGTSRDAHGQIVAVVKGKTGKTLLQLLKAANTSPASIPAILNTDLNLGEGIRLTWVKPVGGGAVQMQFVPNPNPAAKEAMDNCSHSKTYPKAWQAAELPQQLGSKRLVFCGQMLMPANPDKGFGGQNMAQASHGFLLLDLNFTKVLDGSAIPLSQFGSGGTIATVTWTLVWSYQRNQEAIQQFRKGIYHIVP